MTCLEVRVRLTEHSLGVLPRTDAREVERHLEWCAGCRKESAELLEGAAGMALALPVIEPPSSLEGRIIERFRMASGRAAPHRRRLRILVAASLTVAMLAVAMMGWVFAKQVNKTEALRAQVIKGEQQNKDLVFLLHLFQGQVGKTLTATLLPPQGSLGFGQAIIFSAPRQDDFLILDIPIPPQGKGPFLVQMVEANGIIKAGQLYAKQGGRLGFLQYYPDQNLSKVLTVSVVDQTGMVVLAGTVTPYGSSS